MKANYREIDSEKCTMVATILEGHMRFSVDVSRGGRQLTDGGNEISSNVNHVISTDAAFLIVPTYDLVTGQSDFDFLLTLPQSAFNSKAEVEKAGFQGPQLSLNFIKTHTRAHVFQGKVPEEILSEARLLSDSIGDFGNAWLTIGRDYSVPRIKEWLIAMLEILFYNAHEFAVNVTEVEFDLKPDNKIFVDLKEDERGLDDIVKKVMEAGDPGNVVDKKSETFWNLAARAADLLLFFHETTLAVTYGFDYGEHHKDLKDARLLHDQADVPTFIFDMHRDR